MFLRLSVFLSAVMEAYMMVAGVRRTLGFSAAMSMVCWL